MFQAEINPYLEKYFQTLNKSRISQIVKYAVKDGKCIRGFIVKHVIETLTNACVESWEPIVCVELIHAASLVIDDLPCMDNDDVRRGKASVFRAFGKHEAILSAFYIVSQSLRLASAALKAKRAQADSTTSFELYDQLLKEWCDLLGNSLLVGQYLDLHGDLSATENMFDVSLGYDNLGGNIIKHKTCSLFSFAFVMGAVFSGKTENLKAFKDMGLHFGMMFQLMDDAKDMGEDKKDANYILSQGKKAALTRYLHSRDSFVSLLHEQSLHTQKFIQLIEIMDARFLPVTSSMAVSE